MSVQKPKIAFNLVEAAQATGVSDKTIRRAVACGDLPVKYPTSRPVVMADDLRAWVESAPSERRA